MKSYPIIRQYFICFLCLTLGYGCSTQQDTAANRRLQNLSARYNYVYNSNVLLSAFQDNLSQTFKDDYNRFLPLYLVSAIPNTTSIPVESKELSEITAKAQTIISEKNFSNYIDEAYLLLGKTNFYKGNYYNAAEYFSYVERAFKTNKNIYLHALTWKARTYLQLNNEKMAARILDSVKVTLDSVKHHKAEALATLAQLSLNRNQYKDAANFLEKAISKPENRQNYIRWTYVLAQLYEQLGDFEASLKNYTRIEHSNAPFEMYFNAHLSKIRIADRLSPNDFDRKGALLRLVKDDKNADYIDQIYFEVAEDYLAENDFRKAENYYRLSAKESSINQTQKGLAYLRLADLHFKTYNDYINARLYYDSALVTLGEHYPAYEQLSKKVQNLTYLTDRYTIVHTEDTLQLLARLPEAERTSKIAQRFTRPEQPLTKPTTNIVIQDNNRVAANTGSTFYFNHATAVSRGFTDFKKRWGNRSLENNWRQSIKPLTPGNNEPSLLNPSANTSTTPDGESQNSGEQIKAFTARLPLSPEQLNRSHQKIRESLFEIAVFYQQVLNDPKESIKAFEILLQRYPDNPYLETVYYSLYRDYQESDQLKSDHYKNLILTRYPNSAYAKTILDPSYTTKQSALEVEINKQYNLTFNLYEKKDYQAVIEKVKEINQRFPGNMLQIQSDYLKAIAIGKTAPVDSLLTAFHQLIRQHPADSLITPLVKDHLSYIEAHLANFKSRKIALLDFDETEPRFMTQTPVLVAAPPPP